MLAGGLQTLFEVGEPITREVTAVFILPKMFALLGNPGFNSICMSHG